MNNATKIIQKLALTGVHGNLGELVPHHVMKTASQNQPKTGIDAGPSMVSKIVALVAAMNISTMLKDLAIRTINVPQFACGVSGANGARAIQTVNKV